MVDSKDKERNGEAATILYEVISNLGIVSDAVPVLVACNKQDLPFSKKAIQLERDLANEIDQIRKVKKATREMETEHALAGQ